MYLEDVYQELVNEARQRVRTGLVSERSLARLCGVSQPHLHNVLKSIRALSTDSADRLMRALDLSVPELLWGRSGPENTGVRAVPLLRNRLGPGTSDSLTNIGGYVPFSASMLRDVVNPIAARIAPDLVMPRCLLANDLALLDQNAGARTRPDADSCWLVKGDWGVRIRYVRMGGTKLYLADESTLDDPGRWGVVSLRGTNILDTIRAKVIWLGREIPPRNVI